MLNELDHLAFGFAIKAQSKRHEKPSENQHCSWNYKEHAFISAQVPA
jgi:hypothetical protein